MKIPDEIVREAAIAFDNAFKYVDPNREPLRAALRVAADYVLEEAAKECERAELFDGDRLKNSDPRLTCAELIRARKDKP